mmetsp:Transcript_6152/g.17651  ORF Transcript_6152/g.17651 Transcript_6152/m.17651 type:complete len:394 (-) Transcript_6152:215-1396(-)|eukprot:CAMPEP_0206143810 /NCGR_PEP_ID=MMETSP1473-20131121/21894_1 /ASSEMBLY_ACC=CAM_ASM_001109 /TAXON_ID=1461547 /ORGANISM="Stichococcus sp, Strain RCC1054" /LENGTH=393 /DNA_ID=CAMNT_0053539383 /DNA_START=191 /DNA_END=1372 /DNA_ORIENTATION=-
MVSRHAKKRAEKRSRQAGRDVEERLEELAPQEFEGIPSADLFFEDKAGKGSGKSAHLKSVPQADGTDAQQPAEKQRKILKSAAILAAGHSANPLPEPERRKRKQALSKAPPGKQVHASRPQHTLQAAEQPAEVDLWGNSHGAGSTGVFKRRKSNRSTGPSPAAVEVDAAGCSYNPDAEQHQDAVAAAVAAEVQKALDQELRPQAPPRFAANGDAADASELDMLQVDEDVADDSDEDGAAAPEDASGIDRRPAKQKTTTQRNREARRKAAEAELAKRQQRKAVGAGISQVDQLTAEIEAEEAARQARLLRKQTALAEKRAVGPPRLGKQSFEPAPVQVLLTEELQGSLRTLKAAPMLARDRYKSLQQRGIIEPRSKSQHKPGRKLIVRDQFSSR